jgi:hypothetical protein
MSLSEDNMIMSQNIKKRRNRKPGLSGVKYIGETRNKDGKGGSFQIKYRDEKLIAIRYCNKPESELSGRQKSREKAKELAMDELEKLIIKHDDMVGLEELTAVRENVDGKARIEAKQMRGINGRGVGKSGVKYILEGDYKFSVKVPWLDSPISYGWSRPNTSGRGRQPSCRTREEAWNKAINCLKQLLSQHGVSQNEISKIIPVEKQTTDVPKESLQDKLQVLKLPEQKSDAPLIEVTAPEIVINFVPKVQKNVARVYHVIEREVIKKPDDQAILVPIADVDLRCGDIYMCNKFTVDSRLDANANELIDIPKSRPVLITQACMSLDGNIEVAPGSTLKMNERYVDEIVKYPSTWKCDVRMSRKYGLHFQNGREFGISFFQFHLKQLVSYKRLFEKIGHIPPEEWYGCFYAFYGIYV